jgi:hypothetical protein
MHALMAAVLLRPAGLDAFDCDAEAQPSHRELGEVEKGIRAGGRPRSEFAGAVE